MRASLLRAGRSLRVPPGTPLACSGTPLAKQKKAWALVTCWLAKLGLTIHPTKTRLCHAREEPFDFLGYTFGPVRHWQIGKRFISARPSKKAQKRLKEKVSILLFRGNPTPWPKLQERLNRLLSGWAEYFSFGFTGQAYDAVCWHVRARVRRFLCRRHKLRASGTSRFGYSEIHGKAGVIDIRRRRLQGKCGRSARPAR